MADLELFGAPGCPYTAELRAHLEADGCAFVEYDVEADEAARRRLLDLTGGDARVPVLVEQGRVAMIGWRGRGCYVAARPAPSVDSRR
jgi:mycoredoxin